MTCWVHVHNLCMAEASGECGVTVDKSKGVDKDIIVPKKL